MSDIIDIDAEVVEALQIVAVLPETPVVLANASTMQVVAQLEASAAAVAKVTDAATDKAAWETLSLATKLEKQIEDSRQKVKAPFYDLGCKIDAAAKTVSARVKAAKAVVQRGLDGYRAEQERQRVLEQQRLQRELEEAHRKRIAAEKALEAERRENDRLAREAEAAMAKKNVPVFDLDELEEPPVAEARAQVDVVAATRVPAVVAKPAGAQWRVTLNPEVIDARLVPESLLKPREADLVKIRQVYCVGFKDGDKLPEVAGLKFNVQRTPIAAR
jgi:predicted nucleotidyltransferase